MNLPLDKMKSLDIIKKLYDGDVSPRELERELSEEEISELRQLVEAKRAVESLDRHRPSAASIAAINEVAIQNAKQSTSTTLRLILASPVLQRFAAAAVIIVAVGVGYMSVTLPLESVESAQNSPAAQKSDDQSAENAPNKSVQEPERPYLNEQDFAAAPLVVEEDIFFDEMQTLDATTRQDSFASVGMSTAELAATRNQGRTLAAAATVTPPELEEFNWDEEPIQTFYWQVQALSERSPSDDWEESVPLEGSFQRLESSAADRGWIQARSEQ